jgi:hypothetical protein
MTFFTEMGTIILKFRCKRKRPQIAKAILSKMSNAGGNPKPDFKLHCRAIVTNQHGTSKKPDT